MNMNIYFFTNIREQTQINVQAIATRFNGMG